MFIKQLSVFIENKAGRLSEILNVLRDHSIDISALSIAETTEFGVLRMIVDDPETAKIKLRESGVIVKTTDVIGIVLEDKTGTLAHVVELLTKNGVAVEYSYAFLGSKNNSAFVVLRTDAPEKAEKVLLDAGVGLVHPSEIYRV